MSNDRRVFVLAGSGEVGPYTNDDLRHEVAAGTIQRSDQVRTASGKVLGTVGEQIGGHAHAYVSGRMAAASTIPANRARARTSDSGQMEAPQVKRPTNSMLLPAILVGMVAVFAVGGQWLSSGRTAPSVARQPSGTIAKIIPRLRISAVTEVADAKLGIQGLVRIEADKAPNADVVITLQSSGTAVATDVQAIPEKVVLPAGKLSVELPIVAKDASTERVQPRTCIVRLRPGPNYALGGVIYATVTLKSGSPSPAVAVLVSLPVAHVPAGPAPMLLSGLLKENFLPRNPYSGAGGGVGWNGPWVGNGMQFMLGSLAPAQAAQAAPVSGSVLGTSGLKNGSVLFVDFGEESHQTDSHFNNIFFPKSGEPGSSVAAAVLSDGQKTGVVISVSDSFLEAFNQGVDAAGMFPATAQRDAFRLDRASDTLGAVTIAHLDPSLVYDVDIFASTLWPENVSVYTIGSTSITLDPANNTDKIASFLRLVPDARGALIVEVRLAPGSLAALMSAMKITARSPVVVTPAVPVTGGNTPPTITTLPALLLQMGRASELLSFTVADKQTLPSSLKVTVAAFPSALIASLVLSGTTANRTLRVTPAAGLTGKATITLSVSDGTLQATQQCEVTVTDLGHAVIPPGQQFRKLAQRVTGGLVWLSYYANAPTSMEGPVQITYSPWKSLGPFYVENHVDAFAKAHIDEQSPDPQAPGQGPVWVGHPEWSDGEVHMFAGDNKSYSTYVSRTISVSQMTVLPLAVGSDDGLKIWLNGEVKWSNDINRVLDTSPDVVHLTIQPGVNVLLMKIANSGGASGFSYRDELLGRAVGVSVLDGEQEQIFTGYSRLRTGISVEHVPDSKNHYAVLPAANFRQGTHVVVCLRLESDHTNVSLWVDPPPGPIPPTPAYAQFEAMAVDRIRLHVDPTLNWEVSDLRVGSTWDEVVSP